MNGDEKARLEKLAEKLMRDVYHPLTACVWMNEDGAIDDLYLFDTLYCRPEFSSSPKGKTCALISNHFDGGMRPYAEDLRNWKKLSMKYPERRCCLMIYSEYEGVCEAKAD